jgi:hypothetical protein
VAQPDPLVTVFASPWRAVVARTVPDAIEAELAEIRDEVLTVRQNSDVSAEAYLAREWEARLRRLLDDNAACARWTVVVVLLRVETPGQMLFTRSSTRRVT